MPGIDLTIEGPGISPGLIPIGRLAEFLNAIASTFEAIGAERQRAPSFQGLVGVFSGSAAYELSADDDSAADFCEAARSGGRGFGSDVRLGLNRIHRAGTRFGDIRITPRGIPKLAKVIPFIMPEPIAPEAGKMTFGTKVFGTVEGVLRYSDYADVELLLMEGGRRRFRANLDVAGTAISLFGQKVSGAAEAAWDGDRSDSFRLETIEPWRGASLLDALARTREHLLEAGHPLSVQRLLDELDD